MKMFFCIHFFFVMLLTSTAHAVEKLPEGLTYSQISIVEKSNLDHLDQWFEKEDFAPIRLNGEVLPFYEIDWIDRAYISQSGRQVLLKANIELNKKVSYNAIYAEGEDFIVHLKADDKSDHALYFTGFSEGQIRGIVEGLTTGKDYEFLDQAAGPFRSPFWAFLQEQQAWAADNNGCQAAPTNPSMRANAGKVLTHSVDCLKKFFGGIWSSTGGELIAMGKGLFQAVWSPIKSFKSAAQGVSKMAGFVGNFRAAFGNLSGAFMALPTQLQAKVICEVAGNVGGGALQTMLMGPAGALSFLRTVGMSISKIQGLSKMPELAKFGADVAAKAKTIKGLPEALEALKKAEEARQKVQEKYKKAEEEYDKAQKKLHASRSNATVDHSKSMAHLQERMKERKKVEAALEQAEKRLKDTADKDQKWSNARDRDKAIIKELRTVETYKAHLKELDKVQEDLSKAKKNPTKGVGDDEAKKAYERDLVNQMYRSREEMINASKDLKEKYDPAYEAALKKVNDQKKAHGGGSAAACQTAKAVQEAAKKGIKIRDLAAQPSPNFTGKKKSGVSLFRPGRK